MVVDSSVAIAILQKEPGWQRLREMLLTADGCLMSAAALVEAGIVMAARLGQEGARDLDRLVAEAGLEIVPFDAEQASCAREAFGRFGKGRHPARLNFGDCLSYGLAKHLAEPLLFVGDDFAKTDVRPALAG